MKSWGRLEDTVLYEVKIGAVCGDTSEMQAMVLKKEGRASWSSVLVYLR